MSRSATISGSFPFILMLCAFGLGPGCTGERNGGSEGGAPIFRNGRTTRVDAAASSVRESDIRFSRPAGLGDLTFAYKNGEEAGHYAILESLGGGVAVLDFDGDAFEDLFFTGGGSFRDDQQIAGLPGCLLRNRGGWDLADTTEPSGLNAAFHYSHGASAADFDNDGFPDLLVTGYGGLSLWQNQGDGTFAAVTGPAGLADQLWSSSAAWGDLNGDGALDLYVAHYVDWSFEKHPYCDGPSSGQREVCPPRSFDPLPDTFYLSAGDGTFRDASAEWRLRPDGKGLGVVLGDLDLDGDLDVYVTNDTVENFLYENVERSQLKDVSLISGASLSERGVPDGSMGVNLFDYNRDGLPDLWVVNYERESCALYENSGKLMFRHVSQPTGVTAVGGLFVGWGTNSFDMDRDGDEDIFVSNGHVIRYPTSAPLRQHPLIFENEGGTRFRNVAPQAGTYCSSPHMGRGIASGDLDRDGDIDLALSNVNETIAILSNDSRPRGGWISIDLIGTRSARDAVGAIVTIRTPTGSQMRQYTGGGSYASTVSRRLFFGLGQSDRIEEIEVLWPSGLSQKVAAPRANSDLQVIESAGR